MNVSLRIFAAAVAGLVLVGGSAYARWSDVEASLMIPVPPPPATVPATQSATSKPAIDPDDEIGVILATTQPATNPAEAKPEIKIPKGKPWNIRVTTKGIEIAMLVPEGWEKLEPTDKNPPVIFKPGKTEGTQRASWYFLVVEAKRDKPDKVLDRAIVGRTTTNRDFVIREQKAFKLPDGNDAATLLYTARDKKGAMYASRETYRWLDDDHLVITFEWAVAGSWRECHDDMEAITASLKLKTFPPEVPGVPTSRPSTAPVKPMP